MKQLLLIVALISTQLVTPGICIAQDVAGSITLESEERAVSPYKASQNKVISRFDQTHKALSSNSFSDLSTELVKFEKYELQYLTAVYLYCTINSGTCPIVLNGLREMDVIYSRLNDKVDCPNLKQFWKIWVQNDMEKRQNYSIKTSHMRKTTDFNSNIRPKYIKCQGTVQEIVSNTEDDNKFYQTRYSSESAGLDALKKTKQLASLIKKKFPNIYVATGLKNPK